MRYLSTLCLTLCIISLSACITSPQTIKLAAVYNLKGTQSEMDIPSLRGAKLAVEEINRSGGILNRHVQLDVIDGESRIITVARKTSTYLRNNPDSSVLFGLSDTDMVLAAAPLAAKHQHLFLGSGATSPLLPQQIPNYLYLACFSDNVQAAVAAEWAYAKLKARSVTIIYNKNHAYTRLLQGYFKTRFTELGGTINTITAYDPAQINARTFQDTLHADIVYLAAEGPEEALELIKTLRKSGFQETVIGGDGFDSAKTWAAHPDLDNIFFTSHGYLGDNTSNPKAKAFVAAFQEKYPDQQPDAFAALGYDSVGLIKTAIENALSELPGSVLQAFSNIENYQGVTGKISYSDDRKIPIKPVTILAIENGGTKWVEQKYPKRIPDPKQKPND